MSYTFICTPEKAWYLKLNTVEQLLEYWQTVFNPRMQKAYDTLDETKEYGKGMHHCDELQMLIGVTTQGQKLSYQEAYEKIVYDHRIGQYKALCAGETIYVNKNFGWNSAEHKTEQFIHKNNFEFPKMEKDRLEIKSFPMGKHFYVFIDGVQLRRNDNLKFNSKQGAEEFAKQYLKGK